MDNQAPHTVLDFRVTNLEKVVERVSKAVESIDESLKTLTRLDVKHDETSKGLNRAFLEIDDHEKRIRNIEEEMPTTKLIRGWVIAGVVGVLGMMGVAMIKMVVG